MEESLKPYCAIIQIRDGKNDFSFPAIESDMPFLGFNIGERINADLLPPQITGCREFEITNVLHHIINLDGLKKHTVELEVVPSVFDD